jgi:hypothetical protein
MQRDIAEYKPTFRFLVDGRDGDESGRSISEVSLGSFRRGFRFPGAMASYLKGCACFQICSKRISALYMHVVRHSASFISTSSLLGNPPPK